MPVDTATGALDVASAPAAASRLAVFGSCGPPTVAGDGAGSFESRSRLAPAVLLVASGGIGLLFESRSRLDPAVLMLDVRPW